MKKFKGLIDSAKDALIPKSTERIDGAADAFRDTAHKAVTPGDGRLITLAGQVAANPESTKGHALEHAHEAAYNANAQLQGKPYRAIRIPPGKVKEVNEKYGLDLPEQRLGEPDLIVINTDENRVVAVYQAKAGTPETVKQAMRDPKYQTEISPSGKAIGDDEPLRTIILTTSDNSDIAAENGNVVTEIDFGGVTSSPVSNDLCEKIAGNPELAETLTNLAADGAEVVVGVAIGGGIAAAMSSITEAIKILGKAYRGEEIDKELLLSSLKQVFEAAKRGALRGALVKVLQIILDSQKDGGNLPVVIVSVGFEVYPVILAYLNDEITFEEMIQQCGVKALSSAVVVILCMTYPPLGLGLMGLSILSSIWKEFELGDLLAEYMSNIPHIEKLMEAVETTKAKGEHIIIVGQGVAAVVYDKSLIAADYTRRQANVAYAATRDGAEKLASNIAERAPVIKAGAKEKMNSAQKAISGQTQRIKSLAGKLAGDSTPEQTVSDRLVELKSIYDRGLISSQDYDNKKTELLRKL